MMSALVLPGNPLSGEPPDAMKHVRWSERGGCKVAPYSLQGVAERKQSVSCADFAVPVLNQALLVPMG